MDDTDLSAEQVDEEVAARERADQEEARRRAEIDAHPHNQLQGILKTMRAPAANQADVNTRLAYLHAAVRQLVQLMLGMIPPPREDSNGEVEQRQQQSPQGPQ